LLGDCYPSRDKAGERSRNPRTKEGNAERRGPMRSGKSLEGGEFVKGRGAAWRRGKGRPVRTNRSRPDDQSNRKNPITGGYARAWRSESVEWRRERLIGKSLSIEIPFLGERERRPGRGPDRRKERLPLLATGKRRAMEPGGEPPWRHRGVDRKTSPRDLLFN